MTGMEAETGPSFWQFSLDFYRRPAVAQACLRLQDDAGVDVNLLLFLLWQATRRRLLSAADVRSIEDRIRPWRDAAVVPLRSVRRALKHPPPLVDAGGAEALRSRIKAVELEGERLQQEGMQALADGWPGGLGTPAVSVDAAVQGNLAAYRTLLDTAAFPPEIADLLAAALRRG